MSYHDWQVPFKAAEIIPGIEYRLAETLSDLDDLLKTKMSEQLTDDRRAKLDALEQAAAELHVGLHYPGASMMELDKRITSTKNTIAEYKRLLFMLKRADPHRQYKLDIYDVEKWHLDKAVVIAAGHDALAKLRHRADAAEGARVEAANRDFT